MPKISNQSVNPWRVFALAIISLVAQAILLFWPAGTLWWRQGWVFLCLFAVQFLVNTGLLLIWNPTLIEERIRPGPGMKDWDKPLMALFSLSFMGILVVAGLDHRFGWSQPRELMGPALFLNIVGASLFIWAMVVNPFFSKVVRIQKERGHHLVDRGPYGIVRHPGYLGFIVQWFSVPLMLDSVWAFLPYLLTAIIILRRTFLEDQTLAEELPGYAAYRQRVKFRLLPGVW